MIPEKQLDILIAYSNRDGDNNMILKEDAPKSVVEIAKTFHWAPYQDGYIL